ncbi:hypothetical protein FGO68_gene15370 [Halteria grandinella]|uniref:Uncharacterized protein n=1 Tax=Halteria grandinella TaxID=5974 RepID=A0A8J8NMF7_HALGN|nr:hypothetical protein FGO68_gene15370 [Halteria grandinella]
MSNLVNLLSIKRKTGTEYPNASHLTPETLGRVKQQRREKPLLSISSAFIGPRGIHQIYSTLCISLFSSPLKVLITSRKWSRIIEGGALQDNSQLMEAQLVSSDPH